MSQSDRPSLKLEIDCQIETALNQIHNHYWPRLEQMQELTSEARDTYSRIAPHKVPPVPIPRSPNALKMLLGQYAAALFESEATYYPNGPELPHWLMALQDRITSMVLDRVAQVERSGGFRHVTLSHHSVRLTDMQAAISAALETALEEQIKKHLTAAATASFHVHIAALDAGQSSTITGPRESKPTDQANKRKAFVEPILLAKGWSILDWANEAEVAYHTAADYLTGTTNPFRSSRTKLAKALGVPPNALP